VQIPITDPADPRLGDYRALKDITLRRRIEPERGLFMAESAEVIERAVGARCKMRSLLTSELWLERLQPVLAAVGPDVPVYIGDREILRAIAGFNVHRGAIAAMERPPLRALDDVLRGTKRIVILEDIVDHTNVGAIIRGAAGLGVDAVLVSPRCADPLYRRSVRVSMGTVFQVPWTRIEPWPQALDLLRDQGFTIAAMALTETATDLDVFAERLGPKDRLALLLGTEGHGLTPHSVNLADAAVRIPMAGGVDSLNVAAAAAVAFWATRARP